MKYIKILVYIFILLLFAFIVFRANFSSDILKNIFFKKANTQMSISEGNLEGKLRNKDKQILFLKSYQLHEKEKALEDDNSLEIAEHLDDAKIQTKNGVLNKNIYKLSKLKKYGLVDDKGKSITKFIYDDIELFSAEDDLYRTKIGEKQGLINAKGGVLLQAKFEDISKTKNADILLLRNSKYYGLYDKKSYKIVANPIYKNIEEIDKNVWKLYSDKFTGLLYCNNGIIRVVKPKYDDILPYKTAYKIIHNNKEGLISPSGIIISEPIYYNIDLINEQDFNKKNVLIFRTQTDDRYGVIFCTNDEFTVVSPIYSDVQYKGRVNVLLDGYWRILDNRGNVIKK